MGDFVAVFIEIEKGSNLKYEYNRETQQLELDRVLLAPYFYPYAYGFIPQTKADDGDELDVVLVTDIEYKRGDTVISRIVGVLEMEDEKGRDEKIIAIPFDEYLGMPVEEVFDFPKMILDTIHWFFSNYKKDDEGKWAEVKEYHNRNYAYRVYDESIRKYNEER